MLSINVRADGLGCCAISGLACIYLGTVRIVIGQRSMHGFKGQIVFTCDLLRAHALQQMIVLDVHDRDAPAGDARLATERVRRGHDQRIKAEGQCLGDCMTLDMIEV